MSPRPSSALASRQARAFHCAKVSARVRSRAPTLVGKTRALSERTCPMCGSSFIGWFPPRSSDPLEALGVALPAPHIDIGAVGDHRVRLVVERAHRLCGAADDQRVVGKALALGDERAGTDQAAGADLRA